MHLRRFSTIYMGNKSKSLETKNSGTSQQHSTVSTLTLNCQTTVGTLVLVSPDMAKLVMKGSDQSENLLKVLDSAQNDRFSLKISMDIYFDIYYSEC